MISATEKDELRKTILAAGELLLSFWPGGRDPSRAPLEIQEKPDGSIVTNADLRSNEMLMSALTRIFPNDAIHSEEVAAAANLFTNERVWIIDPLDGTSGFAAGTEEFSILMSLTSRGKSLFGFMYFPTRGLLLEAEKGKGALRNGAPLRVSVNPVPKKEGVYARHSELADREQMYPVHLDSGVAFGRVAGGDLDAAIFRLIKLKEWDLAAPAIVIEEAGGKVSDELGNPVVFEKGKLPKFFVASNSHCHDNVLKSLIRD